MSAFLLRLVLPLLLNLITPELVSAILDFLNGKLDAVLTQYAPRIEPDVEAALRGLLDKGALSADIVSIIKTHVAVKAAAA